MGASRRTLGHGIPVPALSPQQLSDESSEGSELRPRIGNILELPRADTDTTVESVRTTVEVTIADSPRAYTDMVVEEPVQSTIMRVTLESIREDADMVVVEPVRTTVVEVSFDLSRAYNQSIDLTPREYSDMVIEQPAQSTIFRRLEAISDEAVSEYYV